MQRKSTGRKYTKILSNESLLSLDGMIDDIYCLFIFSAFSNFVLKTLNAFIIIKIFKVIFPLYLHFVYYTKCLLKYVCKI